MAAVASTHSTIAFIGPVGSCKTSLILGLMGQHDVDLQPDTKRVFEYPMEVNGLSRTLRDTPGDRDQVQNLIEGVTGVDACVLVLGVSRGVITIPEEDIIMVQALGIPLLLVACDNMEDVEWSQDVFNAVTQDVLMSLRVVGYPEVNTKFIPLDSTQSRTGNVCERSQNSPWYDGEILKDAVENVVAWSERGREGDVLRVALRDVIVVGWDPVETLLNGFVMSGTVHVGDNLIGTPGDRRCVVEYLGRCGIGDIRPPTLTPGHVSLQVDNPEVSDGFKAGTILSLLQQPLIPTCTFTARLWLSPWAPRPIRKGQCRVYCHMASIACKVKDVLRLVDRDSSQVLGDADMIHPGHCGVVLMDILKPQVVLEPVDVCPGLGRLLICQENRPVGCGVVLTVESLPQIGVLTKSAGKKK